MEDTALPSRNIRCHWQQNEPSCGPLPVLRSTGWTCRRSITIFCTLECCILGVLQNEDGVDLVLLPLVAQMVKNPPAVPETWVSSLD